MLPDTVVSGADDFWLVVGIAAELVDAEPAASRKIAAVPVEPALVAEEAFVVELVFSKNT